MMMKVLFLALQLIALSTVVSTFTTTTPYRSSSWIIAPSSPCRRIRHQKNKLFMSIRNENNNRLDKKSPPLTTSTAISSSTSSSPEASTTTPEVHNNNNNNPLQEQNRFSNFLWEAVIVILCALWASNFTAAKLVMAEPGVDSALYALARFGIAALALLPGAINSVQKGNIDAETAKGAAVCGAWVAFGYLGQTLGLLTTTASKSCVICSMHCVFVAVVAEWIRVQQYQREAIHVPNKKGFDHEKFNVRTLMPAAVAVAGVAIIELQGAAGKPTIGDLLSFAQPIGFGLGYLQLEELMKRKPEAALPVSAIKLIVVAFASFLLFEFSPLILGAGGAEQLDIVSALWPPRIPDFQPILSSTTALSGILYTGLITTALALWIESIAFKRVPATDASIILTTEPLFAAGAGALALGERFGVSDYVGATLIIGACILAVLIEDEEQDPLLL